VILGFVSRLRSRELFTLTVLVLALGVALGSAMFFGVSMALGAFLAGMVVGQSEFSSRAASEALPMRDAFAVLEMKEETVKRVEGEGWHVVHGDASRRDVLERAGMRTATGLVYAASGSPESVIRMAKEMNPKLLVLARTTYLADIAAMKGAGANAVVAAEGEVALAMVERMLERLGATADQLDRARDRVRRELTPG